MANICDTTIHFTGSEECLDDLFKHLVYLFGIDKTDLIRDIAQGFGVSCSCRGGDIKYIDSQTHTIEQQDRWEPCVEIWEKICNDYYNGDISFVYRAEEPGSDIFINTDLTHLHFPEKIYCDYYVYELDAGDVLCFTKETDFLKWLQTEFDLNVDSIDNAKGAFHQKYPDESNYLTIGIYQERN